MCRTPSNAQTDKRTHQTCLR